MAPRLIDYLALDQCPHCSVDKPSLKSLFRPFSTKNSASDYTRLWCVYACGRCGGCVMASAEEDDDVAVEIFPVPRTINADIPEKPREYLSQSLQTLHAPSGSVMLSGSAVDAMLKEKGYTEGSLHSRIKKAASDHLITEEMSEWAHEVRLEANIERHADGNAPLATQEDASRIFAFAEALGQFLFVLPAMVKSGRAGAQITPEAPKKTRLQKLRDSRPSL